MISGTEMGVDAVEIIKIEVIVRNVARRFTCKKISFQDGWKNFIHQYWFFDYKSDEHGDPMINEDIALALGLATKPELAEISKTCPYDQFYTS